VPEIQGTREGTRFLPRGQASLRYVEGRQDRATQEIRVCVASQQVTREGSWLVKTLADLSDASFQRSRRRAPGTFLT